MGSRSRRRSATAEPLDALDDRAVTILLPAAVGRFVSGKVRCPPLALERISSTAA